MVLAPMRHYCIAAIFGTPATSLALVWLSAPRRPKALLEQIL
jgi:hypothetical protein